MSRRLVAPHEVTGWQRAVAEVMAAAQARMRSRVGAALDAHGLDWSSPSNSAAGLWSQAEWNRVVDEVVEPVALDLAGEMFTRLRSRVNVKGAWGGKDDRRRVADLLVLRAKQGGQRVADAIAAPRAVTAAGRTTPVVRHPDAQRTVADAYQMAFDQLNKLAESVASHMSQAAQQVLIDTAAKYEPLIQNVWCCSFVERSREAHMDADGQRQNAGVPFEVGGELLLYPGDPEGSDENTANCLCWLEVEELEVADLPPATGDEEADVVA